MKFFLSLFCAGFFVFLFSSNGLGDELQPRPIGRWTLLPIDVKGISAQDIETFRILFISQVAAVSNNGTYVETDATRICFDASCAASSVTTDIEHIFFGNIRPLGQKIFVTMTLVERSTVNVQGTYQLTIRKVEELEAVANRIAKAVATGESIEESVDLENVVSGDTEKFQQREGRVGFGLRPAFIAPLHGFAKAGVGVGLDFSVPYELENFMVEPRLGFRWDANTSEDNEDYFMLPFDVGAFYIFSRKDFAPYAGGGVGLRYLRVDKDLHSAYEGTAWDSTAAFGGYARLGCLMFRTYPFHLAAYAEIDTVFSEVHDDTLPTSFGMGLAMFFMAQ